MIGSIIMRVISHDIQSFSPPLSLTFQFPGRDLYKTGILRALLEVFLREDFFTIILSSL
jgi:hypothetical protein